MNISSSGFQFSGWLAGVRTQVPSFFAGRHYMFHCEECSVSVQEEHVLTHSSGSTSRARCSKTGVEFDLRRLRIGAEAGGLITLAMLEALERESQLAMHAGSHPHIVRCHASIFDNLGTEHCRLLLCDASCSSLSAHVDAHGGALPMESVLEIGQQLALGLRHLHSLDILCGDVTSQSVLLGCDGKWKLLGELGSAAELPCSMEEWHDRRTASSSSDAHLLLPPEARAVIGSSGHHSPHEEASATAALDIWMLGALLARVVAGIDDRGIGSARAGHAVLAATEEVLLCPVAARFWMLLHWLLATEPLQRPWSRRLVAVIHSLAEWCPQDLLIEMPEYARFHCQGMASAAARRLAFAGIGGMGGKRSCAAGLPLEVLRQSMADPSDVDELCVNCGLELADYPTMQDNTPDIPSLVPAATLCAEMMLLETTDGLCNSHHSGFQTDESTDEGSISGGDSTEESDRGSRSSGSSPALGPMTRDSALPRQRRPKVLSSES